MGIRLENVSYQDKIKNISYEFEDGKITTVIGSSSSGKTLLSYILSGIIDDYTGNIISTYKNREIGYIFQRPDEAFIFETVKEELAFGIRKYNYRVDEIDKRMEEALKMVKVSKEIEEALLRWLDFQNFIWIEILLLFLVERKKL